MRPHNEQQGRPEVHALVAEPHRLVRAGLRRVLEAHGAVVVGEAGDAETLERLAGDLTVDVVLLDGGMPGDGLPKLVARIRDRAPGVEVVVTGEALDDQLLIDALMAGACSYVTKQAAPDLLGSAVIDAARGKSHLDPRIARGLIGWLRTLPQPLGRPDAGLTRRELEVIRLVAEGCDNHEIAAALSVSLSTVKQHVKAASRKLNARNRVQAAVEAVRSGLL